MEELGQRRNADNLFLCKKSKRNSSINVSTNSPQKNESRKISSLPSIDSSTDFSFEQNSIVKKTITNNSTNNSIITNYTKIEDVIIPSFLNDKTKNDELKQKIKNYYKALKYFSDPSEAELYLIDVKLLEKLRKKSG